MIFTSFYKSLCRYFGVKYLTLFTLFLLYGCSNEGPTSTSNNLVSKTPVEEVEGSDPLYQYQWYLKNSGQKILSFSGFKIGEDINWSYSSNYSGEGVNVVVSDGRIQIGHEDLLANANFSHSRNYINGISGDGGNPDEGSDEDNHGTLISGLIAAVKDNSIGITGVAGNSSISGYNYIDSSQSLSITLDNYTASLPSIFNFSYGFHNCEFTEANASEIRLIKSLSIVGNIYVTAAGNDFVSTRDLCGGSEEDSYLGNSYLNEFKNLPEIFVISAINGFGTPAEYSTPGPNLLVSAPGGFSNSPMIGLDLEGCDKGVSTSASKSDFDRGGVSENDNCNYVIGGMMGTSFAAPLVTGVIAQMKELCEDCDFRDIRHAIIKTATHRNDISWVYGHPLGFDLEGYDYHLGFVTNSYGLEFNNDMGFGVIDSTNVLKHLEEGRENLFDRRDTLSENGSSFYSSGELNLPIPDNNKNGVSSTIHVDSHNLSIEHILVSIRLNHTYISDLGIDLISPSGTRHRLTYINSNVFLSGDQTLTIGVNGFYGEFSQGSWTLEIVDGLSDDSGNLISWNLSIMGGKWGRDLNLPLVTMESLNVSGNVFSWEISGVDVLRFDICVKLENVACEDADWFSVKSSENTYEVTHFKSGFWSAISPTDSYSFYIRAIDINENESEVLTLNWTVASE